MNNGYYGELSHEYEKKSNAMTQNVMHTYFGIQETMGKYQLLLAQFQLKISVND